MLMDDHCCCCVFDGMDPRDMQEQSERYFKVEGYEG